MAKSRDAIRMNEAEIAALFAECKSLQVATLGPNGEPHLTTLWFTVHDGNVIFETYGKSQKVMNLRRDSRIAVLCEAGETYEQLRGVSIQGRAELVEQGERLQKLMRVLVAHHFAGQSEEQIKAAAAQMAQKRIVVVVHADKTISWDHRKLGGKGPL
ncbi:MAG: pyridoxamine 5'-phosphate oxidase family protein [Novosphingobium sp.]